MPDAKFDQAVEESKAAAAANMQKNGPPQLGTGMPADADTDDSEPVAPAGPPTVDMSKFKPFDSPAPAAPQQDGAPTVDMSKFKAFDDAPKKKGILDTLHEEFLGPNSLLAAPVPEGVKQEGQAISDIAHGDVSGGISKFAHAQFHVIPGSPIEKLIQKFDPSFQGAATPEFMDKQGSFQTIADKPLIDAASQINKNEHPEAKAIAESLQSFTSPGNVAIMAETGGLGMIKSVKALAVANKLVSAGFALPMVANAYKHLEGFKEAYDNGDANQARYELTHALMSGTMGYLASKHAAGEEVPVMSATDNAVANKVTGVLGGIKDKATELRDRIKSSNDYAEQFEKKLSEVSPPTKAKALDFKDTTAGAGKQMVHIMQQNPDISTPEMAVDAIDKHIQGIDKSLQTMAKDTVNNPKAVMTGIEQTVRQGLDDAFERNPGKFKPQEKAAAVQSIMDLLLQEEKLEGGEPGEMTSREPNLSEMEGIRQRLNSDSSPNFGTNAPAVPPAERFAKAEAAKIARAAIDQKFEDLGYSNVKEYRGEEKHLIDYREQLKKAVQKSDERAGYNWKREAFKTLGWAAVEGTGLVTPFVGPAMMVSGAVGHAHALREFAKWRYDNPNLTIEDATKLANKLGPSGAAIPERNANFNDVMRPVQGPEPGPAGTPPAAPIPTPPPSPPPVAPSNGTAPQAIDPSDVNAGPGPRGQGHEVREAFTGDSNNRVWNMTPEEAAEYERIQDLPRKEQTPALKALKLRVTARAHDAVQTRVVDASEEQGFRYEDKPVNPTEGAAAVPVSPNGASNGAGTANDRPQVKYKPSEKAQTMSAPTKDLGRDFREDSAKHEYDKAKDILRNPDATAQDKAVAQMRIDEYREQLSGQVAQASKPETEELKVPKNRMPSSMKSPAQLRAHEAGHAVVGDLVGLKPIEVRSHLHPEVKGAATTKFDYSDWVDPQTGTVHPEKAAEFLDKILTAFMGGGAAEHLLHGVPITENKAMFGDLQYVNEMLQKFGLTPEEASTKIDEHANKAIALLDHAGTLDAIRDHTAERSASEPKTLQMGPEKVQNLLQDVKKARTNDQATDAGINQRRGTDTLEHGGDNDAGAKSRDQVEVTAQNPNAQAVTEPTTEDYKQAAERSGTEFRGFIDPGVEGHPGVAVFQDPESGTSIAVHKDKWSDAQFDKQLAAARERMSVKPGNPEARKDDGDFSRDAKDFVSKDYMPEGNDGEDHIYHVTTAKDKVLAEGLKSRNETKSAGLGGGYNNQAPDKVSTTFDAGHAAQIEGRLKLAARAAREEISPSDALDHILSDAGISDDTPEDVARALHAPEETYEDWDDFNKWLDKEYTKEDAYSLVQDMDDALPKIFPDAEHLVRVGLTASKAQMAKIDPSQIHTVQVEARKGAKPEHIHDEAELRFDPKDVRIVKDEEGIKPENPEAREFKDIKSTKVSESGKDFADQKFPHSYEVKVTWPDGDQHIDEVKGLNAGHALSRAKGNWDGASNIKIVRETTDDHKNVARAEDALAGRI